MTGHLDRTLHLTLLAAGLGLLAVCTMRTQAWVRAEAYAGAHRDKVESWATGSQLWRSHDWNQVTGDLQYAAYLLPYDASLQDMLGSLYVLKAAKNWGNLPERNAWLDMAIVHQRRSTQLRPLLPQGWANLAFTQYLGGYKMSVYNEAITKAMELGPHELNTRRQLLNVALGRWDERTPQIQSWVQDLSNRPQAQLRLNLGSWLDYYGVSSLNFK